MRSRFKVPRFVGAFWPPRPPARPRAPGGGRQVLARFAALACIVGLTIGFAWPALATSQTETDADAEPAAPELRGSFTVTITEADVPRGLPGGPSLRGLWTITFSGDGTYTLARQDVGVVASGTYTVEGATLTFNDWTGLIGCGLPEQETTSATYAWQIVDETLTLSPITEQCTDRRILLTTRSLGSFEACVTEPLLAPVGAPPVGTPVGTPLATPVSAATPSVAVQEGLPQGATAEEAIDHLLAQATGCWATGDPARFLPLHSQAVIAELLATPNLGRDLELFMSTPVSFERIGEVNLIDPTHAWAYVEIGFGGETIPQRFDFVLENGVWLFDTFFLFGPPPAGTVP